MAETDRRPLRDHGGSAHRMTGLAVSSSSKRNQVSKSMNKLKKLFSPAALAATASTGMLMVSVAVALAEGTYSSPTHFDYWNYCNDTPPAGEGSTVCFGCALDFCTYWCCWYPGYSCGDIDASGSYGWCLVQTNRRAER